MAEEDALNKNSRFPIMDWAKRLQAIAQTGLAYTKDQYDAQRYGSVRQIASEMMSARSANISTARLVEIFDCEVGYATPKIDVRAAAFSQDTLLLVKERSDGAWTLPGGWADVGDSPNDTCLPLDAAKAWVRNPNATDTFEFGGVKGCFSTMEIHRNGRPVILTCKEFKTLAYLIKNPRRVISRDELLNQVWGYENYPSTRTVDNHILRLRKKLETEPAHPKHFHTVHSSGYKFLP